ncbi:MAG: hypothetical protein AB1512_15420 [Thermodesulfobacteriota bacterium]
MKAMTEARSCWAGMLFLLLFLLVSCSSLPYLNLTYRLPTGKSETSGRRIALGIEDERRARAILGAGAMEEFGSTETFSFALAEGRGAASSLGIYDYPQLVKEAFKRRLEHAGIGIVSGGERAEAEISIGIREFFLDLVNRKWHFRMAYEARLIKNGRILATQNISGEGERMKIFGRDQAEELVGEIFTDTLNQLNPRRLLDQAGL